jgi:hypothetical protein
MALWFVDWCYYCLRVGPPTHDGRSPNATSREQGSRRSLGVAASLLPPVTNIDGGMMVLLEGGQQELDVVVVVVVAVSRNSLMGLRDVVVVAVSRKSCRLRVNMETLVSK